VPGYGKAFKSSVRKHYPALIAPGGFGEVLPRQENRVTLDTDVKDAWGIPVLRFDYRFSTRRRSSAAAPRTRPGPSWRWRGGRWIT